MAIKNIYKVEECTRSKEGLIQLWNQICICLRLSSLIKPGVMVSVRKSYGPINIYGLAGPEILEGECRVFSFLVGWRATSYLSRKGP